MKRVQFFLLILLFFSCKTNTNNHIIGENTDEVSQEIKSKAKTFDTLHIVGEWTEELWLGVESKNLPSPPPARIPEHDSIWPPYYVIDKNEIRHYFLGIDSATYKLDHTGQLIISEGLRTDIIGYQKIWRFLKITDSVMVVERKFSKYYPKSQNHVDGIDTVTFFKKH